MNARRAGPCLFLLVLVGCGGPPPSAPLRDGGPRIDAGRDGGIDADVDAGAADADVDTGVGPEVDTGVDTGVDDAGMDAGVDADVDAYVEPFDANLPDAYREPGPCELADGGYDVCACGTFGADCSTSTCGAGEQCLADGCGMHCAAGGGACGTNADCAATSMCTGGACVHTGGGCADSRDCAPGHSCDSGACRDRRIGCRPVEGFDCPWGFVCDTTGVSFCRHILRHCDTAAGCDQADYQCTDLEGDGRRECLAPGTVCDSRTDCAAGTVCTTPPALRVAQCDRYGPCRTPADCASGMECRDLWGDGIRECVEPGGCTAQTACTGNAVCGTPESGGPPVCIARPL